MAKTNASRRFPGTSNRNRPDKAEQRKLEAEVRQDISNELTPKQRLDRLDMKFGVGKGATKERKRLTARLENGAQATVTAANVPANVEVLAAQTLPDEVMREILALNEESSKKKVKAKERRARDQKNG